MIIFGSYDLELIGLIVGLIAGIGANVSFKVCKWMVT